ncbi:MAG: DUF503 domain-containing protein [Phycisphaerales bacterium]
MVIGLLQFELVIHGSESLKDKRRVVRSVKDRLHRQHRVAVAEVASQDVLNLAVLGLACVGSDGGRVGEVLDAVTAKLRALGDAELGAVSRQVITTGDLPPTGEHAGIDEPALADELLRHFDRGRPPPGHGRDER